MRRGPAAVRSLAPHRLALAAVMVTALLSATLLAGLVSFAATVTDYAVRSALAASPATGILVTSSADSAATAARDTARVRAVLRRALPSGPLALASSLGTDYLDLPAAVAGSHAQTHLISLPDLARHAVLVAGTWPGLGRTGAALPVAVPAATADRLHLRPGSTVSLTVAATSKPVTVLVTGIFRQRHQAGVYWALDPANSTVPLSVGGFTVYPSLVATPAAMAAHGIPVSSASWAANLDIGRVGAGSLAAMAATLGPDLNGLAGKAGLRNMVVTTGLPGLLAGLEQAVVVARSQLAVGILILLVIAGATLALAVSLLSSQREAEAALLRARGASRSQLTRTGLGEAVLLVTPAAVAGPVLGGLALPVLAARGPLAHSALRIGVAFPAVAWLAGAAAAAGCGLIIMRTWLSAAQSPARAGARGGAAVGSVLAARGRRRAVAAAARSGADLGLFALALLAGWQLAHYRASVTLGLGGSLGVDPILVTAPVLALAAAAVLMLRVLPLVARIGDRAAVRRRDLTAAVAAWQISRRPVRQAGPVLLAVLAVATSVIAFAEWSTWQRSVQDQASFTTGADVRVSLPPAAALPADRVATIARARGVTGSTPVIRAQIGLPNSGTAELLALDTRQAAGVARVRPDLAGGSPAAMLRRFGPRGPPGGTVVPGRPARLLITTSLSGQALNQPVLFVNIADSFGIPYQVQAGLLTPDGRPHTLAVPVAPHHGAAYPLRITGFSLQYLLPKHAEGFGQLQITAVRGVPGMTGTAGAPAAQPRAGENLTTFAVSGSPGPGGALPARPNFNQLLAGQQGYTAIFHTGAGFGPRTKTCGRPPFTFPCGPHGVLPGTISFTAAAPPAPLPAVVTRAFASAVVVHPGQTFPVIFQNTSLSVRVVSVVSAFPTVNGPNGGVIVDQGSLQQALAVADAGPAPVTEWWLRSGAPVRLAGLPRGTTVTNRASVAAALLADPLAAAPQLAMLAIAAAAVILAAGGFFVAAATARERAHDLALLAALGATKGQLTRLLCLEQAVTAIPAAAAGLLLGALLARLVVPAVTLTATGSHPQPPALLQVPVAVPVLVALAVAGVPVLLAASGGGPRARVSAHTRTEASV